VSLAVSVFCLLGYLFEVTMTAFQELRMALGCMERDHRGLALFGSVRCFSWFGFAYIQKDMTYRLATTCVGKK
jgi:hypothetical protein